MRRKAGDDQHEAPDRRNQKPDGNDTGETEKRQCGTEDKAEGQNPRYQGDEEPLGARRPDPVGALASFAGRVHYFRPPVRIQPQSASPST
ncbi:hypothetical protein GCM10009081_25520 [Brevundimonas nasdae]